MDTTPDVLEARRIGVLTASFRDLQGLVLVPLGVWLVALAVPQLVGLVREGDMTWFILSLPVPVVGAVLARRYYRRRYGEVRPRKRSTRVMLAWLVFWLAWFFVFFYAVSHSYTRLGSSWIPVSLEGVGIAVALTALAGRPWRLRAHWLLLALLVAAVAVVPLGLLTAGPHPVSLAEYWSRAVVNLIMGLCLVIGGLGDHRVLARSLDSRRRTGTA